jgi:hypothetical protein
MQLVSLAAAIASATIEQGNVALAESATGGEALRRYLHASIDSGLGAVNIIHGLLDNSEWPDRRAEARDVLDRLIEVARRDGAIDQEVTPTDIALATIRVPVLGTPNVA